MNIENSRGRKAELLFAANPKVDEFHVTADDTFFFNQNDADNHAKTLSNRKVDSVRRGGAQPTPTAADPEDKAVDTAPIKKPSAKSKAPAKPKAPAKKAPVKAEEVKDAGDSGNGPKE